MVTGADVDATSGSTGLTPLHFAAMKGHMGVTQVLMDRGMGWYWCSAALKHGRHGGVMCTAL
jgi:ankyrin repeat protein